MKTKALMILGLVLIALAAIKLNGLPDVLQYMILAPAQAEDSGQGLPRNQPIAALIESFDVFSEELAAIVKPFDLSGSAAEMDILDGDSGYRVKAGLVAVGEGYFELYHHPLTNGRYFYSEELKYGGKVAVIDSEVAFLLFGTSSFDERYVIIDGGAYRVVGVVRHSRRVGEAAAAKVFIPIAQAAQTDIKLDTLTVSGKPIKGMGADTAFPDIAGGWKSGGNYYNLNREAEYSLLTARILGFFIGMWICVSLIKRWTYFMRRAVERYRTKLELEYASRIICPLLLKLLGGAVGYLLLSGAVLSLIWFLIAPVMTFTDWIPSVLVDPREIIDLFWAINARNAAPVLLRSPQVLYARHYETVSTLGVIVFLLGLALGRIPVKKNGSKKLYVN
jgi:hypothetical protein